jgi:hypothetical protein
VGWCTTFGREVSIPGLSCFNFGLRSQSDRPAPYST